MGKCKAGVFVNNVSIRNTPFACFGFKGRRRCRHLMECATQQIKPVVTPAKWKAFREKFSKPSQSDIDEVENG